jgi:type I restriction enzyme S subunit
LANLTDALIPLPPLAEQQRIAAILGEAELVKRKRELMIKKAMDLKQSIFLDMFGDLVKNTNTSNFVSIAEFIHGFEGGKSFAAEADENAISKYRILKISSVTSLKFIHSQSKPVPILYVPPQNHFVKKGDLLFSRANTTELVGATAYVKETPANLLLPDKLWRFVWHEPPKALPLYVCSLFQSPQFRSLIGGLASGSSGSMKNISQAKVFSIKVGHPPLQLQYKFTKIVEAIDANLVLQDISSKKINDMNLAIQSKLLSASLYL